MSDFTDDVLSSEAEFIEVARKPRELRTSQEAALLPQKRDPVHRTEPVHRLDEACGSAIRCARLEKGWNVYELASRLGSSATLVTTSERGDRQLTPSKIARFATALGLKPSVLLRRMAERLEDIDE